MNAVKMRKRTVIRRKERKIIYPA